MMTLTVYGYLVYLAKMYTLEGSFAQMNKMSYYLRCDKKHMKCA